MGIVEGILTIVTAALGTGGIVTVYLKHRLDKEARGSEELRAVQIEIDLAKIEKEEAHEAVLDQIYECQHGKIANGNLDAVYVRYHDASSKLKKLYNKRSILLKGE